MNEGNVAETNEGSMAEINEGNMAQTHEGNRAQTMLNANPRTVAREEILNGLCSKAKYVPSKYFYDATGAALFDEITQLDEYYLTRVENTIFDRYLPEISERLERYTGLIEYGSGSGEKTLRLLDHLPRLERYIPVDISEQQLQSSAQRLASRYPRLEIKPLFADFTKDLATLIPDSVGGHDCVFFPGSTIGNFEYPEATAILARIAGMIGEGGGLLIGVDLAKDPSLVERAYNDRRGVTARFNKNILSHVNALTGSDFDLDKFDHLAVYNEPDDRIEMYLVSRCEQTVHMEGTSISLNEREKIRTEYSYKYPLATFRKISEEAGFDIDRTWLDDDALFGVLFLRAR